MPRLTQRIINAAQPGTSDYFIWDETVRGLGVRIFHSGRVSWLIQYRSTGRTRRYTLGPANVLTPAAARKKAAKLLAGVRDGEDPSEARHAALRAPTVHDLAERYLRDHAPKKKTAAEDRRLLEKHILPALGHRRVESLTHGDVDRLHASMRGTRIQANRVLALLSTMMRLAERWGMRRDGSNPCCHVKRYAEARRERFLSSAELARLGDVLRQVEAEQSEPASVVPALRLLILTGARRGEVLGLRWADVDFEGHLLRLRDSKSGAKVIRLNAPAPELLSRLERRGVWVFPTEDGSRPIWLSSAWARIRRCAQLDDLRIHDLRHAFASVGVNAGMGLPVIGALLGHRKPGTTARYAHLAEDPIREASETIGQRINAALEGRPPAQVVGLREVSS